MALYGWSIFLSVLPVARRIQNRFDFDVIDAHYVYPDGFAAMLLGRYFKKPVVVSARGSDINVYRTLPLIRRLVQSVLTRADKVVAVSRPLKDAMVDLGVPTEKIIYIPNGVDTEKFYPKPKEKARRALGLADRRMILSVGSLTSNKGFDIIIRAFERVAQRFSQNGLQLCIVGDGVMRRRLEKLISTLKLEGQVRLMGSIPHEQLADWYNAADLFCLASAREGSPNVILESLACGTPVLATPAGGIPDIIRSENHGVLVGRNEVDIASAMYNALSKSWFHEELAEYARTYSWDDSADNVFQTFQSVLDRKRTPVMGSTVLEV
jgi:glycosyltransferase involved in cell wall biosynthesis